MAYNTEAKRMFERFGHQLSQAIKYYRLSSLEDKIGYMISDMLRNMPESEDKEQLVRVLNCEECFSVKEDKYGNTRYVIPFKYFMKEGCLDENFVRSLFKDTFRAFGSRERYVTTAASHYELLAKVIMVLGRD